MRKSNNNISNLIVRYLKGKLDENQKKELNLWLEVPRNKQLFDEITTKERILNKSTSYDVFNSEKAWKQIDQKISVKINYRRILAYAAVIVLPLAIGFFILNQVPKYNKEMAQFYEIKPGEFNAKLYFANGEVVDLKKDTSSRFRSADNLVVEKDSEKLKINSDLMEGGKRNKLNRIVTPIGGEYEVELPDGTVVKLNADSYLEFPSKFSGKERRVVAKGELYFDVAKNKDWPFIVESEGMELKVLGTEFNVRAYSDEKEIISTLVEGSVEVSNSSGELIRLTPDRQVVLNKSDQSMLECKANIESVTAWKNGKFIFDNRRIEDIMYDLARWYDVKVFFANSKVKDKRFSVDVPRYGEIESILTLLKGTGETSFTINKNVITVK
ncbi:FecR domain-containing protein [Labilibaculum manganireducens]|uniref:FecR family protein n=1 Tax=Labilibaculum manganireducens TaxID=1940525 RepID=UPI0029F4F40D|nr:FecR domain-containing protein [Labilibaculum manganireducens]